VHKIVPSRKTSCGHASKEVTAANRRRGADWVRRNEGRSPSGFDDERAMYAILYHAPIVAKGQRYEACLRIKNALVNRFNGIDEEHSA
jgi:hypothetical protein